MTVTRVCRSDGLCNILLLCPQSLVSKTLDSVSAQFAASALMTSDQLLTLKVKEDGVGGGVNGVVQASGLCSGQATSFEFAHPVIMLFSTNYCLLYRSLQGIEHLCHILCFGPH